MEPTYQSPESFSNVKAVCKANVFFDGKVVSHSIFLADGSRKSLGIIAPGEYHFDTAAAERMEIIAGQCRVRVAGQTQWIGFEAGTWFDVPANSFFDICVDEGLVQYVCSFS
ncbi:MAG: pyrimidine/purine nucleoside phosphorylase [Desulfuromonadaceae bacterium]|nr:pyrimidine/purine nucleoside phosphorylase [Desulfuromonadaceae bacterium]